MAFFEVKNLNFSYPASTKNAVNNISFKLERGEVLLICGTSGSGKTTLINCLSPDICPCGTFGGNVMIEDTDISKLSQIERVKKIGFVFQDPEAQIVSDKVWHEIAFPLESVRTDKSAMRSKVAEIAAYFNFEDMIDKSTHTLSGGQKQRLNIASALSHLPEVLVLDEPFSRLDPVACENIFNIINKINKELGTTVIISEHNLEKIIGFADKIAFLDNGNQEFFGNREDFIKYLYITNNTMVDALPVSAKIFKDNNKCFFSVADARAHLSENQRKYMVEKTTNNTVSVADAVVLKDVCFSYSKNEKEIINNLSLKIPKSLISAVIGPNGAGKSTLIKLISGEVKQISGKIKVSDKTARISVVPQDPKNLFSCDTIYKDIEYVANGKSKEEILNICNMCGIDSILNHHPYDISCGEMQKAALCMALVSSPDILLLDEPTKGIDAPSKLEIGKILKSLSGSGVTVVLVTHDIEFAAMFADTCSLIFNGEISSSCDIQTFMENSMFFTTDSVKITRNLYQRPAVLPKELRLSGEVYE